MSRWPELWKNSKKEHDPDKITAYHEAGHSLIQVFFGLIPRETSLIGFNGTNGFASGGFTVGYDLGVDWAKEGPEYALMLHYGGIVGASAYSGWYSWQGASSDMRAVEQDALHYKLNFSEQLRIWVKTHRVIEEYYDLLTLAAEKLYIDKVLSGYFWEEMVLLSKEKTANIGKQVNI